MQDNRWHRFNVFASDLNYLGFQESQNCILEVSMQLIKFSELTDRWEKISLKITGNAVFFCFLKTGTLITPWRN